MNLATLIAKSGPKGLNAPLASEIKSLINAKLTTSNISKHAVEGGTAKLVDFQSANNLLDLIVKSKKIVADFANNSIVVVLNHKINNKNAVAVIADCKFDANALIVKSAYLDTSNKWGGKIPATLAL